MEVKIKLENGCEDLFPKKAHVDDASYDLYSRIDAILEPLSGMAIPVGFSMELPSDYEAQIPSPQRTCRKTSHHCDQLPRHSRCQFSRRSQSDPLQSRQRAFYHPTRRPHRTDGDLQTAGEHSCRGSRAL